MVWIKAFHVISVIAWMAGLLYLPRLFVYHVSSKVGSEQSETFKIMEQRLYRAIMTPAMISSWVFGLWLVFGFSVVDFSDIWVWIKGLLVIGLTIVHFFLRLDVLNFADDTNTKTDVYFRFVNEVPTLIMVGIVVAVIVRPFGSF